MTSMAVTRLMIKGGHDRMPYSDEHEGCGVAPAISWAINRIEVFTKIDDAFGFLEAQPACAAWDSRSSIKASEPSSAKPRETKNDSTVCARAQGWTAKLLPYPDPLEKGDRAADGTVRVIANNDLREACSDTVR